MNNKPILTAGTFLAVLAAAMIVYYKFQARQVDTDTPLSESETVETKRERGAIEGFYSATDGAIEFEGKRVSYFHVSTRDDGSYGAVARMETIGADGGTELDCPEVRASEAELFLRCDDGLGGSVSFDGSVQRGESLTASGRVLWQREGNVLLDRSAHLAHAP